VLSSLLWVWFFSCGYVHGLGSTAALASSESPSRTWLFLALYLVLLLCLGALVVLQRRGLGALSSALNVVAVVLVGYRVVAIASYETGRALTYRNLHRTASIGAAHARSPRVLPNIYYVVLDGYARGDVLKELYQYDNSDFLAYLARRGFSVARHGRANYCQTLLSLASSLNLEYLDEFAKPLGSSSDRNPLITMVQHNRLFAFLREHGYRIVAFPSAYSGTEFRAADIFIKGPSGLSEFQGAVFEMTPIPLLAPKQPPAPAEPGARMALFRSSLRRLLASGRRRYVWGSRVKYVFDHLPETTRLEPPVFVFAHVICPHPPFLFDRAGRPVSPPGGFDLADGSHFHGTREEYVAAYREQVIFVNNAMRATIDALLRQSKWPTVIVLQADHGPGSRLDWDSAARTCQRERLAALVACRLPDGGTEGIDEDLSPVNIFRIVLNRYFDTSLALLPNESYYSTWDHPYEFVRVTDQVEPATTVR
jgi:hypothetical protein